MKDKLNAFTRTYSMVTAKGSKCEVVPTLRLYLKAFAVHKSENLASEELPHKCTIM